MLTERERELLALSAGWTRPSIARTYRNDAPGRTHLEEEVAILGRRGYVPSGTSATEGHLNLGRTVAGASLTGGLSLLFGGSRTGGVVIVTYVRSTPPPAPVAPKAEPLATLTPQQVLDRELARAQAAGGMHGAYLATAEFPVRDLRVGAATWSSGKSSVTVKGLVRNPRPTAIRDLAVEVLLYGHASQVPWVDAIGGGGGAVAYLPRTQGARLTTEIVTTGPIGPGQDRRFEAKWKNIYGTKFSAIAIPRCAATGAAWEPPIQALPEAVLEFWLWGEGGRPKPPEAAPDPTIAEPQDAEEAVGPEDKTCPDCAETVKAAARICRFCRHVFEAGQSAPRDGA